MFAPKTRFSLAPRSSLAPKRALHFESQRSVFRQESSSGVAALGAAAAAAAALAAAAFLSRDEEQTKGYRASTHGLSLTPVAHAAEKAPHYGVPGTRQERTFIAVKPDGVQRGLVGEVIRRFEAKGYKLVAIKMIQPSKEFAEKHYEDLNKRPFFGGLVKFFSSGPVVAMVWEGPDVIKSGRKIIGATDPKASEPGSIRGDLCVEVGRNVIHGSDGADSAQHEISLWFKPEETVSWESANSVWTFEK